MSHTLSTGEWYRIPARWRFASMPWTAPHAPAVAGGSHQGSYPHRTCCGHVRQMPRHACVVPGARGISPYVRLSALPSTSGWQVSSHRHRTGRTRPPTAPFPASSRYRVYRQASVVGGAYVTKSHTHAVGHIVRTASLNPTPTLICAVALRVIRTSLAVQPLLQYLQTPLGPLRRLAGRQRPRLRAIQTRHRSGGHAPRIHAAHLAGDGTILVIIRIIHLDRECQFQRRQSLEFKFLHVGRFRQRAMNLYL